MWCDVAVRKEISVRGVVTLFKLRQSFSLITDTAAPVSTRARTLTPSTDSSISFGGQRLGLEMFDSNAALASGTAAVSFPLVAGCGDVALGR